MSDPDADDQLTGRAATTRKLEEAASSLLRRNGVLAGLNLREVAKEADVNRGLVYQYFGDRRRLLRSALRRTTLELLSDVRLNNDQRFVARWGSLFSTILRRREAVRLLALLVMDGDQVRTMPLRSETAALLARDIEGGDLPNDIDIEAFHAWFMSFSWGYALFGNALAAEFGIHTDELDARVQQLTRRLLELLQPPA